MGFPGFDSPYNPKMSSPPYKPKKSSRRKITSGKLQNGGFMDLTPYNILNKSSRRKITFGKLQNGGFLNLTPYNPKKVLKKKDYYC